MASLDNSFLEGLQEASTAIKGEVVEVDGKTEGSCESMLFMASTTTCLLASRALMVHPSLASSGYPVNLPLVDLLSKLDS